MEDSNTIEPISPASLNVDDVIDSIDIDGIEVDVTEAREKEGASGNISSKKRRRMTSNVWSNYEMLPLAADGKQRCKCKKCGAQYQCDSKYGTGNLKRHLENCKNRNNRDIGQLILQSNSSTSVSMVEDKFEIQEFRELFTACIIMHDMPFQCVEWPGLRAMLTYLRRDLQFVSRNTVRGDCLKLFLKEKGHLQSLISKNASRVCLTSDLWTSINTDGFICLTAHFIDKNWKLQKKIINFAFMPPPHDGLHVFEKLQSFIVQWKLEKKIFSITLDNASSNNVSVDHLRNHLNLRGGLVCDGQFFHMRCCTHIINLIVQAGLKEIDSSLVKVRETVKYVKGSQIRKEKFLECASQMLLGTRKGLRQDVPTRWNSTYIMLESAIYYKNAFIHLQLVDSNFKTCPTAVEWGKLEMICSFLCPFYQITCVFSGAKYPTANLYFPCICTAYAAIKDVLLGGSNASELKFVMAAGMLRKFEKYWCDFSVILAVAVILDPRYKFNFIQWCYEQLYIGDCTQQIRRVRESLFALFSNYSNFNIQGLENSSVASMQDSQSSGSSRSSTVIKSQFLQSYDSFRQEITMPKKSELEIYLDEPEIDRNQELDILEYWKLNQYRFPEVSAMARDVLCIPISTVASESAFSNSGRILDQYRSALKPDVVEALVCCRDWLYGDKAKNAMEPEIEILTENVISESADADVSRTNEE